MDWLQFTDAMVGHLAWPLVVLIVILTVRKHLGSLAERILELSFGGASVKFGKLLSKGADIIDDSAAPPAVAVDVQPSLPAPTTSPVQPAEDNNPFRAGVESVFKSSDVIEQSLGQIGEQLGVKTRNGPTILAMLLKRELVTPDVLELYNTLRSARNAIAHGRASMPNEAESLEYVRQAMFLLSALSRALNELKAGQR